MQRSLYCLSSRSYAKVKLKSSELRCVCVLAENNRKQLTLMAKTKFYGDASKVRCLFLLIATLLNL